MNLSGVIEALMVKIRDLIKEFFVQCFISDLRDTIKNQVTMFQPTTLIEVVGFTIREYHGSDD